MKKLRVKFEKAGEVIVELIEKNPNTRDAFLAAVPFEARANLWGKEVYFSTPVKLGQENSQSVVQIGDVGYWPPGNAMCLFFGPTPVSPSPDKIMPASPVNVFGQIIKGLDILEKVKDGEKIIVEEVD